MKNIISEYDFPHLNFEQLRADFYEKGCVIIRDGVEKNLVEEMKRNLCELFQIILRRNNVALFENAELDDYHSAAIRVLGPERSKYLLTIGRDISTFSILVSSSKLNFILSGLFQSNTIQTIADSNVLRIDRPYNDVTILDWHQDYPYNMLSMNAATVWAPITPVDKEMGCMRVCSPMHNLLPIQYDHMKKKEFHNSRYIQIKNLPKLSAEFEASAIELPKVNAGDIVLMHALSVHASGKNRSEKSRFVFTARYASFDNNDSYERNWFTVRAKYPDLFKSVHPKSFFEINKEIV